MCVCVVIFCVSFGFVLFPFLFFVCLCLFLFFVFKPQISLLFCFETPDKILLSCLLFSVFLFLVLVFLLLSIKSYCPKIGNSENPNPKMPKKGHLTRASSTGGLTNGVLFWRVLKSGSLLKTLYKSVVLPEAKQKTPKDAK